MLLRVRLDPPGWFANDPRVVLTLDGDLLYEGSFVRGFAIATEISAGRHVLATAIHLSAAIARRRAYTIDVPESTYREQAPELEARLRYSRLWGNFTSRLEIAPQG